MNIYLPHPGEFPTRYLCLNVCTQVGKELFSKLDASSFYRNRLPSVRVPVGLLHRIVEAKIGNKQKILDHSVPGPTDYFLIELLKSVCTLSMMKK